MSRKRQGAMLLFYLLCIIPVAMFLLPEVGVLPRGYGQGIGILSLLLLVILQTGRGFYRARTTHAAGLDFLDIAKRIEKRFGVRLEKDDWETLCRKRRPADVSVGELHDYICAKAPLCGSCGYDLSGLAVTGRCPECGGAFDRTAESAESKWEALQEILTDALLLDRREITRRSFLIKDLWGTGRGPPFAEMEIGGRP